MEALSILITHYNRLDALIHCIHALQNLDIPNMEIIVSDDGSHLSIQEELKKLPIDILILNDANTGLTSNINRGLKACSGKYILYCQEDFIVKEEFVSALPEVLSIIDSQKADMVRLKANYFFPKLLSLSQNISLIPKFSWKNYFYNAFQYSDNPFLTTPEFFERFGYFLEKTSGSYGENEYAIRIMKSKAKIAIYLPYLFESNKMAHSVMIPSHLRKKRKFLKKINLHRFLRASRLHLECLLYNPTNRKLITFKNKRKEQLTLLK